MRLRVRATNSEVWVDVQLWPGGAESSAPSLSRCATKTPRAAILLTNLPKWFNKFLQLCEIIWLAGESLSEWSWREPFRMPSLAGDGLSPGDRIVRVVIGMVEFNKSASLSLVARLATPRAKRPYLIHLCPRLLVTCSSELLADIEGPGLVAASWFGENTPRRMTSRTALRLSYCVLRIYPKYALKESGLRHLASSHKNFLISVPPTPYRDITDQLLDGECLIVGCMLDCLHLGLHPDALFGQFCLVQYIVVAVWSLAWKILQSGLTSYLGVFWEKNPNKTRKRSSQFALLAWFCIVRIDCITRVQFGTSERTSDSRRLILLWWIHF